MVKTVTVEEVAPELCRRAMQVRLSDSVWMGVWWVVFGFVCGGVWVWVCIGCVGE